MMGARLTLGLIAGFLLGCGTMQDMPLYDLDLRPTAEERVLNHVHRDIYLDEANSIMFGHSPLQKGGRRPRRVCGRGRSRACGVVSNRQLSVPGVGFPWGNYMGKNLKPLEKTAAIQCHIKLGQAQPKVPMFFVDRLRRAAGHLQNQPA